MFVDEVKIKIKAGNGGDGIVAFWREKFIDKGGPAGGDGGNGGSIIFKVDEGLSTLMDLRFQKHLKAPEGENGRPKHQHGKNADDLIVKVPQGTTVYDQETDKVIADLTEHGQEAVIAKGGRGGRGNMRFVSSRNTAPEISENGEPGVEREIRVELKVLADVGLVGFPSVGKSTLISTVTAAKPKIAAYHFTTLVPNLGVVSVEDGRSFVMADLPGLIEGASKGTGLGIQFLRHIERTRVIVHVVDMSGSEGREPYDDFVKINEELASYKYNLMKRPQIVAANKMDLPESEANLKKFQEKIGEDFEVVPISSYTRDGLRELLFKVADLLDVSEEIPLFEEEEFEDRVVYKFEAEEKPFEIRLADDNVYEVYGEKLEKLVKMTNFDHYESIKRFSRQLRQMGVDEALREHGVKNGDVVRVINFEFEFIE
ncbi:GTPase ObgE [Haloplasma contractile]|uniref:GTPase Obg n=1 Tax=Haloplasma contractile SSD-17B TaxID=1033810 RepID=F7PVR2_9MOLU|nr:GTPase ObgE [Haloplasma contractile]ERJ12767.1 GTPase ObgE protein [Haloplasma contractile SSD-17B]